MPGERVFSLAQPMEFYLEEEIDGIHPLDTTIERIEAEDTPVWIVAPEFGGFDRVHRWARENGEIRLVLQSRIPRPFHAIWVYRCEPAAAGE